MFPHIQPDTYCMQQKADKYGSADLAGVGRAQSALPSQKNSRASYDRVYTPISIVILAVLVSLFS